MEPDEQVFLQQNTYAALQDIKVLLREIRDELKHTNDQQAVNLEITMNLLGSIVDTLTASRVAGLVGDPAALACLS